MVQKSKPNLQPAPEPEGIVAVAQHAATQQGYPRKCRVAACRRARRCVGPHVRCLSDEMRSLPVRVFARRVAAGRRLLREAETQVQGSDALPATKSQPMARLVPAIQALLSCIGKGAD